MEKVFLLVGSQDLYGEEVLREVARNAKTVAEYLSARTVVPVEYLATVRNSAEIEVAIAEVNATADCVGVITWMHTFSPAQMWIRGLKKLQKPLLHLHTQFNEKIPCEKIDMDYMNLHQASHGDREFGHVCAKMHLRNKVVAGYYKDERVLKGVNAWLRAAIGYAASWKTNVARLGDNMRDVAVTDGDKVSAQIELGWSVKAYATGDLLPYVNAVTAEEINALYADFCKLYSIKTDNIESVKEQIRLEIALARFLEAGGYNALTTNFENLFGLKQLPGLSIQRLMEKGYGFGAEGDWKTAALLAVVKAMAKGAEGGTSFMEDYTYNFERGNEYELGAHMLEICPTIAEGEKSIIVKPLGIGGKEPPARMVFKSFTGEALALCLVDLGDKLRLLVNKVEVFRGEEMPNLPVAQVVWRPLPDLNTAATEWIYAGGGHHTVLTNQITAETVSDFARIAGIETVFIDERTPRV